MLEIFFLARLLIIYLFIFRNIQETLKPSCRFIFLKVKNDRSTSANLIFLRSHEQSHTHTHTLLHKGIKGMFLKSAVGEERQGGKELLYRVLTAQSELPNVRSSANGG